MGMALFSAKPSDIASFTAANASSEHELEFFEDRMRRIRPGRKDSGHSLLGEDALELNAVAHRVHDRVLQHLLDRVGLSPAAEVLLRRKLCVLERRQVAAPPLESLVHERIETRNDRSGITGERQPFDR